MSGIVGRPTAGARFVFERAEESAEAVIYRGFVHLPSTDVPIEATVELPSGTVKVSFGEGGEGGTPDLAKAATALLRAVIKGPAASGGPLPRKVVRWRP